MTNRIRPFLLLCLLLTAHPSWATPIVWQSWSDTLFQTAKAQNKLVILDLEAVWCHWCHVMDEKTYADEAVQKLIGDHYIAVRVDQDSRPDLSNRYEDYGWPATIVFAPDGTELAKRSGYIPPEPMAEILQAFVKDPTPGPSIIADQKIDYAEQGQIPDGLRKRLVFDYFSTYDETLGGWGDVHKYVDADTLEYTLMLAAGGNTRAMAMAKKTLDANLKLIDPIWGGVYQYSAGGTWDEPHFEKIMSYQASDIRIYTQAYALWKRPTDLQAAQDIYRYLTNFLTSPDGAFYTSQDADLVKGEHSAEYFALSDDARRKKGIPAIDQHIYSRENGWAIEALCSLYAVTGDESILKNAKRAAGWITVNRRSEGGGFHHDAADKAGPFLGDTLAMGRAYLALYTVTADRTFLTSAQMSADFIDAHFKNSPAGYVTAASKTAGFASKPQRDENISFARFANQLAHISGNKTYRAMADQAMRYLASSQVALRRPTAGALLADADLTHDPLHITIVGSKRDPAARQLFLTGMTAYPILSKRLEWWDRIEGPLPNADTQYPQLDKAAAFLCADGRCSLPLFTVERLQSRVAAPKLTP